MLLFSAAAVPASAQTVTGTITGTVVDNTGAVVVGASVTLTSETTGAERQAKTTESGVSVFAAVPPGTCTIKVEVQGFRTFQRTGIVLTANDRMARGNIEMTIGQVTETVTVEARGAAVNTESAESTVLLSSNQLNDMTGAPLPAPRRSGGNTLRRPASSTTTVWRSWTTLRNSTHTD
ncbi:MAG: carboxypeptidase regulatory-like domain-containing protein [Acidobacteria bacterium]|nr:carboxypeptidase regulatory-like domain-containing protein [Acidobacteriota bacterium]